MAKLIETVRRVVVDAAEIVREGMFDAVFDLRDNALRGFGVPSVVSSVAALGIMGVAAAGTASVAGDLIRRVNADSDCKLCSGWKRTRCVKCNGTGRVSYKVDGLVKGDGNTDLQALANAVAVGSAKTEFIKYNANLPLPSRACSDCKSTGISRCLECEKNRGGLNISIYNAVDPPWRVWDAYQNTQPPSEFIPDMGDRKSATFWLFSRPELEGGFKYNNATKRKIVHNHEKTIKYDAVRKLVAQREPGWEDMQQLLMEIDRPRAESDPVIVHNVPFYKVIKQIESDVAKLEVPPKPANWKEKVELPLKMSALSLEVPEGATTEPGLENLLKIQSNLVNEILDTAWETKWRQEKVKEIIEGKVPPLLPQISSAPHYQGKEPLRNKEAVKTEPEPEVPAPSAKPTKSKKKEKKGDQDEKRKERAQQWAKQSADREAVLAKAKGISS